MKCKFNKWYWIKLGNSQINGSEVNKEEKKSEENF